METINWKKKMEEQLRRNGFTLQVENMSNLQLTEIHAEGSPLLSYPLRIRLYERMGWFMCTVDAPTLNRAEDHPLFERMVTAVFERIVAHLERTEGLHLLTFIGDTGNYIVPKQSETGEIVRLISQLWYDRSFLHLETYEEYPALYATPPWAHQAYAIESAPEEWVIYAGRSGRPPSDYRADGVELKPHRLIESELFFVVDRIPKQRGILAFSEWLRVERMEVEEFMASFMQTIRKYDPSFGFAWGGTKTFFHGIPVEPYAQVLRVEGGTRRYRVMNNTASRLFSVGQTSQDCLNEVAHTLATIELPPQRVTNLGQLVLGVWQQFETDEDTYVEKVELRQITRFQIEEKVGHALALQQRIKWIDQPDSSRCVIQYAYLRITFPRRPPGIVTVEPISLHEERGAL